MSAMAAADRRPALGSLALRPVAYRGRNGVGPLAVSAEPIRGLSIRLVGSRAAPLFHASTNVYGFVDLRPDTYRAEVSDPEGRFLPRALRVDVPDRRPLAEALALGATSLPTVPAVPFLTVPLRPSPHARAAEPRAALHGVVRTPAGAPLPLAWIRVSTAQGSCVTYSDARGEYLAPLPFLRPVVALLDSGADLSSDGDDVLGITDTFNVTARAHRLLAPVPAASPLDAFPEGFDDLEPGQPAFAAVYDTTSFFETTIAVRVETHVRLDLLPG